jgi:hypothetical protein
MIQNVIDAMNSHDDDHRPIVFKDDDGQWTVLRFAPFHQDKFDTWGEAYAHAYWHTRISNVLTDVFAGGDCA